MTDGQWRCVALLVEVLPCPGDPDEKLKPDGAGIRLETTLPRLSAPDRDILTRLAVQASIRKILFQVGGDHSSRLVLQLHPVESLTSPSDLNPQSQQAPRKPKPKPPSPTLDLF